jgi:N-acetylglucosaminyldiphosphoundecaprenol N-acetyl-beta-D-mannosaminyltransferase
MKQPAILPSVRVLGVEVTPVVWPRLEEIIVDAVVNRRRSIIANHNLHSVYLYHHDAGLRAFYENAAVIHIDGMGLLFFGKLHGAWLDAMQRLTPLDWIRLLLADAQRRNWRVFYLGSRPGVAERGAAMLKAEFPGLQLETAHGYFDARREGAENRAVVETINRFAPDLLLVGMGMPRQERWIHENREALDAAAIFNVGGLMDYIAGETPTPPRWMGRVGLEWLFRLCSDPKRLWRRYLVEPWFVMKIFFAELLRNRRPAL